MSGEAAAASAQQATAAENGPTAETLGATTTGARAEQDTDTDTNCHHPCGLFKQTQPHLDIAAATQQQRNKKIEDTIRRYIRYSNFKSYHHLLIDSGTSTRACPKDYAPDLPLRPCGESVPQQLYTVTKKIPVYGIKYVPYKQDNFKIMMPYYVCDVKYPILSASRLLDRGYGLDFTPRHCTITHGQQQAHLRQGAVFTPTDGPGHPPINTLEPHRTTMTNNNLNHFTTQR